MAKESAPDEGFGKHLGIDMVERREGGSLCRATIGPQHLNPHGVLHGGMMYSMADQGMGAAVYSLLDQAELCATIEIKIVYMAAVSEGVVECESRVLNKGKRVAVLESDVRAGGRLVAKALGTYAIFTPGSSAPPK
jgi:acyl-CoA thioesterase